MNADRLIRMAIRMLLRKGTNAGINRMTGTQKQGGGKSTPGQNAQHKQARDGAKRAKQAARLSRRMGKF